MAMSELASYTIGTGALAPVLGTSFLSEVLTCGYSDHLMLSMRKFTLVAVITKPKRGELLA